MTVASKNGRVNRIEHLGGESLGNGAEIALAYSLPYTVHVVIEGAADMLLHRYNVESVEAKGKAAKGSKAKKEDDVESFVYRNDEGYICLPGEYVRQSVIHAAKYRQDPRSPRKSAMDLYKAGIIALTQLASLGTKEWDYLHRCRAVVQRNGVSRTRPAFRAGWRAEFDFMVQTPEYIEQQQFFETMALAGRLIGVADNRPTYGRFNIVGWEVGSL